MTHLGTVELAAPRLVLRRFTAEDAIPMYEAWARDGQVTKYLRWEPHRSWTVTAALLKEWLALYGKPTSYQWGICLRETGQLIGSISIIPSEPDDAWVAKVPPSPHWEPGYALARAHWGQGYATEALCAVRDFWFTQVGGDFLACCHDVRNPASGRVMQKAGFVYDHESTYHRFDGSAVACRVYYIKKGKYGTVGA